jgi:hypothetical protein
MNFLKGLLLLCVSLVALALGGNLARAADQAKVFQGTCVSFDEGKSLVLKNDEKERDKNPVDKKLEEVIFKLEGATLGVRPLPGDKTRVSFVEKDGNLYAHKIMNVTKQNIFKK